MKISDTENDSTDGRFALHNDSYTHYSRLRLQTTMMKAVLSRKYWLPVFLSFNNLDISAQIRFRFIVIAKEVMQDLSNTLGERGERWECCPTC